MPFAGLILKVLLLGLLAFGPLAAADPADAGACWAALDAEPPADPIDDDPDAAVPLQALTFRFDPQVGAAATSPARAHATTRRAGLPRAPPR